MKLEVLISCMDQSDFSLIDTSNINGNALIINQCGKEDYSECKTPFGVARMFSTASLGLTKSRNMAINNSDADICLLCDDDETFLPDYAERITKAYDLLPQADVIVFKMANRVPSFSDKIQKLRFPKTLKVSSWQISFRRNSLLRANVYFDELLGAGSGNGAEEELKFLCDCRKAKLKIYYVPVEIAEVAQTSSTWFNGFDELFFEARGSTTRYILGFPLASLYALYYIIKKRNLYIDRISSKKALRAIFRGIIENKIAKQKKMSV